MSDLLNSRFITDIKQLLHSARNRVYQTINSAMTTTYWEIGRRIVEEEQNGKVRAKYGKAIIKNLSDELTKEFGKGFSVDNLENMRRFYLTYQKSETLSRNFKLSWSHYLFLMGLDIEERTFYEIEAFNSNWSLRELRRQFDTALYQRLVLSRDKKGVKELSQKGQKLEKPGDNIF